MSDDQAIRPTVEPFSITTEQEAVETVVTDSEAEMIDKTVADLKHHIGFQYVRKMIEKRIADYQSGKDMKVDTSDDYEAIGRKYLVSSLVAAELQAVLGAIDDAARTVESESGT